MRAFLDIKVILLIGLFAALVIKGGQICTAGGSQAVTRLVESASAPAAPAEPLPVKPIEEEFRGISPLPALADRANRIRKMPRLTASHTRKPSRTPLAAKSAVQGKSAAQPRSNAVKLANKN